VRKSNVIILSGLSIPLLAIAITLVRDKIAGKGDPSPSRPPVAARPTFSIEPAAPRNDTRPTPAAPPADSASRPLAWAPEDRPIDDEADGELTPLYQQWSADHLDSGSTEAANSYFSGELKRLGLRPQTFDIRCTEKICRSRWSFPSFKELARLEEIRRPSEFALMMSNPHEARGKVSIVIYWSTENVYRL
jgi:hypothetical protein